MAVLERFQSGPQGRTMLEAVNQPVVMTRYTPWPYF
jgi:hypothetical protein